MEGTMKLFSAKSVVAAGLTCALAIGSMGCSFSSSSETSTTVSDGETTTTTTTKTEDGESTTTTMTTTGDSEAAPDDIAELTAYTLSAFGIRYELPEGFKFTNVNENLDLDAGDSASAFAADGGENGSVQAQVKTADAELDVFSDEFQNEKVEEAQAQGSELGLEGATVEQKTFAIGDNNFPVICLSGTKDGATFVKHTMYIVLNMDESGKALFELEATADSEEKVETIVKGFQLV